MSPAKHRKLTPRQEASAADTSAERLEELAQEPKMARLVAANPNAPAELLLELSHSDDKAVRKACTSNANTPVEALLKLGSQFPEQLLENPVFDLLLLAYPVLFEELPTSTLNSLLKRDGVPVELIRWAWRHRGNSTVHSLLMNPNTPADVVVELRKSKDPDVGIAAELHCSQVLPEWAAPIKDNCALESGQQFKDQLELRPTTKWDGIANDLLLILDQGGLKRLLPLLPETKREWVARDGQASTEVLSMLAKDLESRVRRWVGKSSNTTAEVLSLLAKDESFDVRSAVAENSQTAVEDLTLFVKDESIYVRKAVARNSETPAEAFIQLAVDEDEGVREAVAQNRNIPVEVITQLANDNNWIVRWRVARNGQIPSEILSLLAKDENSSVRSAVARNSQTPAEALALLAADQDEDVRQAVAENNMTPAEARALLANNLFEYGRRWLEEVLSDGFFLSEEELPEELRLALHKIERKK